MDLGEDELGEMEKPTEKGAAENDALHKSRSGAWDVKYTPNPTIVEMTINFLIRVASTSNEARDHVQQLLTISTLLLHLYLFFP